MTLIVSFAFCGLIFSQEYESHWPPFVNMWEDQSGICAAIAIDGYVYTVNDEGWDALEVAFFVGDECRGTENYMTRNNVDLYDDPYPILPGNAIRYTNAGETVIFKMYDHINGVEYDAYEVTYQGEPITITTGIDHFEAWSTPPYDPIILNFTTPEVTTVTQTIELMEGTNWMSFNVDITLDDLKDALLTAVTTSNPTITIKSQSQNVKYQRGRWAGQLAALDMALMYKITVPEACEISLEGLPIDPSELTVTINANGSTWIAFPFNESMTVSDFFGSFPVNNDQAKSQGQNTKYKGGRWAGALTTLGPGKGYIYVSADDNDRTFTFPTSAK